MKNLFRVPFALLMASLIFVACSKGEETTSIKAQEIDNKESVFGERVTSENPIFHYENISIEALGEENERFNFYHNDEFVFDATIVNGDYEAVYGENNSVTFHNLDEGYTDEFIEISNVVTVENGISFDVVTSDDSFFSDVVLENVDVDEQGKFCWKCAFEIVTVAVGVLFGGNDDGIPEACVEVAQGFDCPDGESMVFIIDDGWFTTDCKISCE